MTTAATMNAPDDEGSRTARNWASDTSPMRASTTTATGTSNANPEHQEQRQHEAEVLLDVRRRGDGMGANDWMNLLIAGMTMK